MPTMVFNIDMLVSNHRDIDCPETSFEELRIGRETVNA